MNAIVVNELCLYHFNKINIKVWSTQHLPCRQHLGSYLHIRDGRLWVPTLIQSCLPVIEVPVLQRPWSIRDVQRRQWKLDTWGDTRWSSPWPLLTLNTWRSVWQRGTEAVHVPGVQEAAGGELAGVRAGAGAPLLAPQLSHLLAPVLHQSLVLRHPQLLAVHYAGPLGPGPVPGKLIICWGILTFVLFKRNWGITEFSSPVVWVLFHVKFWQFGLFLVKKLFFRVAHGLPSRS